MLTLDLFNTRHEKELHEGAVDNTVARLIEPLSQRAADVRTHLRNGNLSPAEMKALETEYEDLVQKRLDIIHGRSPAPQDECMGYGSLGETDDVPVGRMQPGTPEYAAARNRSVKYAGLPDVADKANKMSRLNQPGKVGSDIVSPQQRVNPNPNKGIIGHAKDWLTGKGGPGKEGPTYESELDEEGTYEIPPQYLFVLDQIKAGFDEGKPYVDITMPSKETVPMTRPQMFNVLATFGNMNRKQLKKTMVRFFNTKRDMLLMLGSPVIKRYQTPAVPKPQQDPNQPGLGLDDPNKIAEAQKKNSPEADLSGSTARDPIVARELRKMRGRQPSARSDIEALVRDEMDQAERTEQKIAQQESEIDRQQQQLTQLTQANQAQSSDITAQGREIDNLTRDLQRAVADLQTVKSTPATKAEPTVAARAEPAYMPPPVPTGNTTNADVQKQIQDLSKDLTMATLRMKEPGVSQAEHDKLQQAVKTLQTEIETLKQTKSAQTKSADKKLNYKKVQSKPGKPKRAGDDAKFMGNVDQGAAQLSHDPYDFSQYSNMAVAANPARKAGQQEELGLEEGAMGELDIERQDLERMTDPQFLKAYGISKEFWKYKNRAVLKKPQRRPMSTQLARSPVGKKMNAVYGSNCPGCGRSTNPDRCICESTQRLHPGDPVIVTAPNEFEGATGEIYDFSPSGKFVVVNLYNHGKHSMHLSDVEYNQYADDQDDQDLDEGAVNPQFINAQVTKILAGEARRMTNAPMAQLLAPLMQEYNLTLQQIDTMVPGGLKKAAGEYGIMMKEGYQDFNKVEPYAVCLAGKPVKKFDYYEQARRFHDNWKQKLYREGNKEKADKITLMPLNLDEDVKTIKGAHGRLDVDTNTPGVTKVRQKDRLGAKTFTKDPYRVGGSRIGQKSPDTPRGSSLNSIGAYNRNPSGRIFPRLDHSDDSNQLAHYSAEAANPAQQAAIAIAMKKAHKKPKQVDEDTGSWIVYDPETKQIKKRFKTHTAGKSYANAHGLGFASSEYYFDRVKEKTVAENDDWDDGDWQDIPDTRATVKPQQPTRYPEAVLRAIERNPAMRADIIADYKRKQGVAEAQTDYQKRRQRERDVDAGRPVKPVPKNPQTDYARKRAKEKRDLEQFGEDINDDNDNAVEQAILRRIMVAHTDLLKQYGPDKVMQAAEEVAYNVGDVDEIGTSDVSAYVNQVRQILGAV